MHKALSHTSSAPELETAVQRAISQLDDKVWVHHPMAAHLLGWLPAQAKLALQGHGKHPTPPGASATKAQAWQALGLPPDAFVLVHTGWVLPCKVLHRWLPHWLAMLDEAPRLVLLLAGRISCDATLAFLRTHPHPRLVVHNQFGTVLCGDLVVGDLKATQRHALLKRHGHDVVVAQER